MIETIQETAGTLIELARLRQQALDGRGPGWLTALRKAALARFLERGLPTTRDEEWRFTNLDPLAKAEFAAVPAAAGRQVTADQLRPFAIPDLDAATLVFVDGRYAAGLSSPQAGAGVTLAALSRALDERADLLEQHLARHADAQLDPFTALNHAELRDGAVIEVAPGAQVDRPILILNVATGGTPRADHPHHLVLAGRDSELVVIEQYVTLDAGGVYLTNAVTEVVCGENAKVDHYLIEADSESAFSLSTVHARQERASRFNSHTVLLGGALVRNNVHVVMAGDGAEGLLNGLYLPRGRQHHDNFMRVEHAAEHSSSRQFYRGILSDAARAVFSGRIVVRPGAQKTDAKQTNANLLLGDEARVDTKPQLEIYADDVKCTHGATIGQIDEEAVFYLRARGIGADEAKALMVRAFAGEAIGRMGCGPLRDYLDATVEARNGDFGLEPAASRLSV